MSMTAVSISTGSNSYQSSDFGQWKRAGDMVFEEKIQKNREKNQKIAFF